MQTELLGETETSTRLDYFTVQNGIVDQGGVASYVVRPAVGSDEILNALLMADPKMDVLDVAARGTEKHQNDFFADGRLFIVLDVKYCRHSHVGQQTPRMSEFGGVPCGAR